VPYEGTVSYGAGTARGPGAILAASAQLEMYDEELNARIDRAGLFTLPPVEVAGVAPEAVMARIHAAALPPLRDGKLLATLGGEHSISYGVFTALREAHGRPFSLLQLDAHADLRPSYQGTRHSHASIMARAHELGLPFVQVGLRSLSEPEARFLRETGLEANVFWAHRLAAAHDDGWMDEVVARLGEAVYVTIDVDGLDPSLMPATGTPEPGGLDWYTTMRLLRRVAGARRVLAFDVTELAPIAGLHGPDFLAARLTYKLIGYALGIGRGEG
jgi:agmatinase